MVTLPVGGTLRSAVDEPVAIAPEISATALAGQTLITGDTAQSILDSIVAHLQALTVRAGGTPGITAVTSDATLSGDGRVSTPLSVANPFTDADETKLDAIPDADTIVQALNSLPSTSVENGDTVIVNGVVWQAQVFSANGGQIDLTMQVGHDPAPAEDDDGYRRGRYGSIAYASGYTGPVRWLDDLYAEDEGPSIILRLRSAVAPGQTAMLLHGGGGTYVLQPSAGATAYTRATPNGHQLEAGFALDPFGSVTTLSISLFPSNPITAWNAIHADDIAEWAVAGSGLLIPEGKVSDALLRLTQATGITGDITITETGGVLNATINDGAVTPAMLGLTSVVAGQAVVIDSQGRGFATATGGSGGTVESDASLSGDGSSGTPLGVDPDWVDERARDALETALTAGTGITITPDDAADTITIAVTVPYTVSDRNKLAAIHSDATQPQLSAAAIKTLYESNADTNAFTTAEQTKLAGLDAGDKVIYNQASIEEFARDALEAALTAGTGVTITPDDAANTITVAVTVPYTTAEQAKLLGIDDAATAGAASDNTLSGAGTASSPLSVAVIRGYSNFDNDLNVPANNIAGHMGVVYGDEDDKNGLYYRTHTTWQKVLSVEAHISTGVGTQIESYTGQAAGDPDSEFAADRIPLATAAARGGIRPLDYLRLQNALLGNDLHRTPALTAGQLEDADAVLLDDASVSSGSELKEIRFSELDKRWIVIGGNETIIGRAYVSGGVRPWPDDTIQIPREVNGSAVVVRQAAYTAADFANINDEDWGNTAGRDGGFLLTPGQLPLRMKQSEFATQPTELPDSAVINLEGDEGFASVVTLSPLGNANGYWLFNANIGNWPAGSDNLTLEKHEPATLNILPPDGSITTPKLKGLLDAPVGSLIGVGSDGEFRTAHAAGLRQVYSGSTGVSPTTLAANSGILAYALDQSVDTDTDEGILFTDDHLHIVAGPTGLSFSPSAVVETLDISAQTGLQQIALSAVYNGTSALGVAAITAPLYVGANRVGAFVRRYSRNANNEVAGNVRIDHLAGDSDNSGAASIGAQSRTYLLDTRATLLPSGAVGHVYSFDNELPDAADYQDGDVAFVGYDDNIGVWRKDSTTGHADNTWNGVRFTIGVGGNLQPVDETVGAITYRHQRYASANYTDPRDPTGTVAAGGTDPGVDDLLYVDLSYNSANQDRGQIDIKYSAAQANPGPIVWTLPGPVEYTFRIPRVDSTTWRLENVSAASVARLLDSTLVGDEPDRPDVVVSHNWTQIGGPSPPEGARTLLRGTPNRYYVASDEVQRTWSANQLTQEMIQRDDSYGIIAHWGLPSLDVISDMLRIPGVVEPIWLNTHVGAPGSAGRDGAVATLEANTYVEVPVESGEAVFPGYTAATKYSRTGNGVFATPHTTGAIWVKMNALTLPLALFAFSRLTTVGGNQILEVKLVGLMSKSLPPAPPAAPSWVHKFDVDLPATGPNSQSVNLTASQRGMITPAGTYLVQFEEGAAYEIVHSMTFVKPASGSQVIRYETVTGRGSTSGTAPAEVHISVRDTTGFVAKQNWSSNAQLRAKIYRWE